MKNGPYILIKAPEEFPGKKYRNKYAYEHTIVWWENTKSIPPKGYILHHRNEDKHDNRFENLELISIGTHSAKHKFKNKKLAIICSHCKNAFLRKPNEHNYKINRGQERFYCCKSHQVIDQHKRKKMACISAVEKTTVNR